MMHVLSAAFYDAEWARFSSSLWPLAWHGSLKWWHGWFRPIEFPFPCHCKFCWISPTCCKASSFSLSLVWNVKAKVHVAGAHSNTDTLRGPTAPVPLLDPLLQPEAFNFVREIIPAWAQIPPEEIIVGLFLANFPLPNNVISLKNKKILKQMCLLWWALQLFQTCLKVRENTVWFELFFCDLTRRKTSTRIEKFVKIQWFCIVIHCDFTRKIAKDSKYRIAWSPCISNQCAS